MTEPTVVTLADPEACSLAAAERIVEILDVAIDDRGEAHWATTGGSTPGAIYRHLALGPLRAEIDWRKVQLWWTDERFVPGAKLPAGRDEYLELTALVREDEETLALSSSARSPVGVTVEVLRSELGDLANLLEHAQQLIDELRQGLGLVPDSLPDGV